MPTTAVTSFGPLFDRLTEALTTLTGKPRALAAADLFHAGYPSGVDPKLRVMLARERPTFFIELPRETPEIGDPELGSEHLYAITVTLSVDFFLGWPMTATAPRASGVNEVRNAQVKIADAFPKVRAALCYANAHDVVTATGQSTGLASGALNAANATATTQAVASLPDGRLINSQYVFPNCKVSWAP